MIKQSMREKDTQTINSEKRRETERQGEKETKEIRKPVGQCSIEYNNLTVRDKSMKEREGERERERDRQREGKKFLLHYLVHSLIANTFF